MRVPFEDEALATDMLGAVEGERGALPLLAFAAARVWERRDRTQGLLTRSAYQAIGGVAGALAQHAEATLGTVGGEKLPLVRELFRNLVTAEGTRAVRDVDELLTVFPGIQRTDAEVVLKTLIDPRLLTSYEAHATEPGQRAGRRVDVVHESLLSAWPRLVRWRTEDEGSAQLRDQLRQAAHLWEEKGRPDDLLWTGTSYRDTGLARPLSRRAVRRRGDVRTIDGGARGTAPAGAAHCLRQRARGGRASRERARHPAAQERAGNRAARGGATPRPRPSAACRLPECGACLRDREPRAKRQHPARRFAVEALAPGPPALLLLDQVASVGLAWSADGKYLAVGGPPGLVLVSRETGKRRQHSPTDARNHFEAVTGSHRTGGAS